jgi:hypothetical protein
LVFLTRDAGEIELSMEMTRHLKWVPKYGKCGGCCATKVKMFLESMADFHLLNPKRTALLDSADLGDFVQLKSSLDRLGIPLAERAWSQQLEIVSGSLRQLMPPPPAPPCTPEFDPFHPLVSVEDINRHFAKPADPVEVEVSEAVVVPEGFDPFKATLEELEQVFPLPSKPSRPPGVLVAGPAPLPAGYKPRRPMPFKPQPSRHPRAIVYPWLSKAACWDELRYSIRSVVEFFEDKECPIYILGDEPPAWLVTGGRVRFEKMPGYARSNRRGLYDARACALQLADQIILMNDDFYFLRPTGWEDMRTALVLGDLSEIYPKLVAGESDYQRGKGMAAADLIYHGKKRVMNFAVHAPFLFERGKAVEVLRKFHINHRGSLETLYHGWHETPFVSCKVILATLLPANSQARFLYHPHPGPDEVNRLELERMFARRAPWESNDPKLTFDYASAGLLPTLSISIMAHPSRAAEVAALQEQLGPVPVAMDDGCGMVENCRRAWAMADPAADYHLVIQDDAVPCENFVAVTREFLGTCPRDAVVSFFYGHKERRRQVTRKALQAMEEGRDRLVARNINGVALCMSVASIPSMLGAYERSQRPQDDMRIFGWVRAQGRRVIYPLPSLVDHRDEGSLVGNGTEFSRTAVAFDPGGRRGDRSGVFPAGRLAVYTLRYGEAPAWMAECAEALEAWVSRHGYALKVWGAPPEGLYPHPKFVCLDMIRDFLAGDSETMLYVDADVFPSQLAGRWESVTGFRLSKDPCEAKPFWKGVRGWMKKHHREMIGSGWEYRNAGVWSCDRESAARFLAEAVAPFHEGAMEQHQFNVWWARAAAKGMRVSPLAERWNMMVMHRPDQPADFYHLASGDPEAKAGYLEELRRRGLLPVKDRSRIPAAATSFDFEKFRFSLCDTAMPMDEFHIHLLHLAVSVDTGIPASQRVAVEVGSYRGASTSALVEALNKGWIGHLHVVEITPTDSLKRVLALADDPAKVTLHTVPFWEAGIGPCDFVFIDGDHQWPALGDTLHALAAGARVICLHDSRAWPKLKGCWGSKLGNARPGVVRGCRRSPGNGHLSRVFCFRRRGRGSCAARRSGGGAGACTAAHPLRHRE